MAHPVELFSLFTQKVLGYTGNLILIRNQYFHLFWVMTGIIYCYIFYWNFLSFYSFCNTESKALEFTKFFKKKREKLRILFCTSVISETRQKSHCSINGKVAPFSMQKLSAPLETIFVEKLISWKNGAFLKFFERL